MALQQAPGAPLQAGREGGRAGAVAALLGVKGARRVHGPLGERERETNRDGGSSRVAGVLLGEAVLVRAGVHLVEKDTGPRHWALARLEHTGAKAGWWPGSGGPSPLLALSDWLLHNVHHSWRVCVY